MVGELDADPVAAEPVNQIGERLLRRCRATAGKCLADMAFAAAGQNVPVSTCGLCQRVVVVAQDTFFTACKVRRRQLARQPSIPFGTAGKHQQVRPTRVGLLGAIAATEGQFGTEHRLHVEFLGGFGEPHHPVEPVVIGQGDGTQIEPGGLLDEFLRRAGAVEEAVRRMRVQLGIRDRRCWPLHIEWLIAAALAGPGRAVATVTDLLVDGPAGTARFAREHPLHLGPTRRPVMPAHLPRVVEHAFEPLVVDYGPSSRHRGALD